MGAGDPAQEKRLFDGFNGEPQGNFIPAELIFSTRSKN
jgi:hypothetical protein